MQEAWMSAALDLARQAGEADEVPVGAVVVIDDEIVGRGFNQPISRQDPTAHAEILAITQAANHIGDWRLNDCTLYVTKEPCPMCAGALIMGRVGRVVFAVEDPKMGYLGGAIDLNATPTNNHKLEVSKGVLAEECRAIIKAFFEKKRIEKR